MLQLHAQNIFLVEKYAADRPQQRTATWTSITGLQRKSLRDCSIQCCRISFPRYIVIPYQEYILYNLQEFSVTKQTLHDEIMLKRDSELKKEDEQTTENIVCSGNCSYTKTPAELMMNFALKELNTAFKSNLNVIRHYVTTCWSLRQVFGWNNSCIAVGCQDKHVALGRKVKGPWVGIFRSNETLSADSAEVLFNEIRSVHRSVV